MITTSELQLTAEDHDKAFQEVCFLLDIFVDTIEQFVGKSMPALAVAAGRKMAGNMPIYLTEPTPENALAELVRVFTIQQMEIKGEMQGKEAHIPSLPRVVALTSDRTEVGLSVLSQKQQPTTQSLKHCSYSLMCVWQV